MVSRGVPEHQARMLIGLFEAARRGEFVAADPVLEELLGRPTQSIRSVLQGIVD